MYTLYLSFLVHTSLAMMQTKGWMSLGTLFMFGTCLLSIALVVPAQLQLSRNYVWNLDTWLALSITQAALAWISVFVAIRKINIGRRFHSITQDQTLNTIHLTIMGLYVSYATLMLVRIGVIYTKSDGNYRVNVLETKSSSEATITNFEVDLREALTFQCHTFAVALGSILSTIVLLFSPIIHVANDALQRIQTEVVPDPAKKKQQQSRKQQKKQEQSDTEEDSSSSDSS